MPTDISTKLSWTKDSEEERIMAAERARRLAAAPPPAALLQPSAVADPSIPLPLVVTDGAPPQGAVVLSTQMLLRKVGEYTVIKYLGEGSFGTTFLALKPVALQFVIKQLAAKAATEEYTALLKLQDVCGNHLSCPVALYRPEPSSTSYYLVSTYMPGSDLKGVLEDHPEQVSMRMLKDFAKQMLDVLSVLHTRALFHRDIKPANIMYDVRTGTFALIDFGLACTVPCSGRGGTPRYALPEYVRAPALTESLLARTDLFALGVTLYNLIEDGNFPYARASGVLDTRTPVNFSNSKATSEMRSLCLQLLGGKHSASELLAAF